MLLFGLTMSFFYNLIKMNISLASITIFLGQKKSTGSVSINTTTNQTISIIDKV